MKKIIMLTIILTLLIFGTSGCAKDCSWWSRDSCDNSCSIDSDCKYSKCCTCINKEESCPTTRERFGAGEAVMPNCIAATCKCVDNKCEFIQT